VSEKSCRGRGEGVENTDVGSGLDQRLLVDVKGTRCLDRRRTDRQCKGGTNDRDAKKTGPEKPGKGGTASVQPEKKKRKR